MNVCAILPAAGQSRRFGSSDKLGQDLGGRPLLLRTVELFAKRGEVRSILVAGPPDTPETHDLVWQVMREAATVGRGKGVNLDSDVVESTMAHFEKVKHGLISSMYADLEAGNPLELDALNGAIARLGNESGIATPINDFITACLTVSDSRGRARQNLA